MGRKNLLAELLGDELTAVNSSPSEAISEDKKPSVPSLGSRGAVGAMSRSLNMISAERDAAQILSKRIASGQSVIEVEPDLIDASFVTDRMWSSYEDHGALVQSIRERGQLVPVLLRPSPTEAQRFQVAYGHRRVRALRELGIPVRAVIRDMSDEELVVAQGKENSDRRDLSFIERSTVARKLGDRKFSRDVIMAALSVDKTELSRLISVSRAVPQEIVDAIGAAPKTGRRRWVELGELLAPRGAIKKAIEAATEAKFKASESDDRFALIARALMPRKTAHTLSSVCKADDGKQIARIQRKTDLLIVSVDEKMTPAFGSFLASRLATLYREFKLERSDD